MPVLDVLEQEIGQSFEDVVHTMTPERVCQCNCKIMAVENCGKGQPLAVRRRLEAIAGLMGRGQPPITATPVQFS
jgi:hypothetical protein